MRDVKLAWVLSLTTPGFDELSILVELQDARIAIRPGSVTLSNKDVAIVGYSDIVRFIEKLRRFVPFTTLAFRSQGPQNFSLRVEFHDRVSPDIGCPDVAFLIDAQTV